jgi:molybdenum cofactor synthesis domain-containing protein
MRVAVITVGDELLSGDTVDTNAAWLGGELTRRGVTVARGVTLPDDVETVARAVSEAADRFDAVIVTGGLGPTHDDRTMAAIAKAFDRDLVEHAEARAWLEREGDYAVDDLTAGTTHLPTGARHLPNEEGVAPGAVVENVYVLPGVPAEMKAMFGHIASEFLVDEVHVAEVETVEPESALVSRLERLREQFDVQVGSYPGETVVVRIRGTDEQCVTDAAAWIRERVASPDS